MAPELRSRWGGSRKGSGRPPGKRSKLVGASIKMDPDNLAWIRLTAQVHDATMGEVVEALIYNAIAHPEALLLLASKENPFIAP